MSAVGKTVHLPITHLVCDCDGVLVDSESVAYLALLDALSARLCRDRRNVPGQPAGRDGRDSGHPGAGDTDIAGDGARVVGRASLAQAIQQRLGLTIEVLLAQVSALAGQHLSVQEIAAMREAVEDAVRHQQQPVPGIAGALLAIGLPVAVASNSSLLRVREAVACSGVGAFVADRLFTADVVGVPKPAPDIYLAACAGFGSEARRGAGTESSEIPDQEAQGIAPLPAHCLAVEDSLTGVKAAVAAGLQVLGFAGGGHIGAGPGGAAHLKEHVQVLRNAGALAVFDDMRALPGIVAALQKRALHPYREGDVAEFLDRPELIRLQAVLSE